MAGISPIHSFWKMMSVKVARIGPLRFLVWHGFCNRAVTAAPIDLLSKVTFAKQLFCQNWFKSHFGSKAKIAFEPLLGGSSHFSSALASEPSHKPRKGCPTLPYLQVLATKFQWPTCSCSSRRRSSYSSRSSFRTPASM